MQQFRETLIQVLGWINFANLLALLLIVFWQVFSRYILNDPSTISEELARIFLMWLGPLGAAYACAFREHMAIDLVSQKLDKNQKIKLGRVINLLCAFFALILITGGWNIMMTSFDLGQTTAVLKMSMGFVYMAIPLGGIFMFLFLFQDFVEGFVKEEYHG